MTTPKRVPEVIFKTILTEKVARGSVYVCPPFRSMDVECREMFAKKKVVLFAIPGAFTPTCSSAHLPGYEASYSHFKQMGIDEVYCLSVNDAFVMNSWITDMGISKVKPIPDGSGEFTKQMGMLVKKDNLGFGLRSWRYSMYVVDGEIQKIFIEPGFSDNCPTDPFEVSDANTMIEYLKTQ